MKQISSYGHRRDSEFFSKICEKVLVAENGKHHRKERPELGGVSLDRFSYTNWLTSENDIESKLVFRRTNLLNNFVKIFE